MKFRRIGYVAMRVSKEVDQSLFVHFPPACVSLLQPLHLHHSCLIFAIDFVMTVPKSTTEISAMRWDNPLTQKVMGTNDEYSTGEYGRCGPTRDSRP